MITVNVADLPALTAQQAIDDVGLEQGEITQPGLYEICVGSRGDIDSVTYLGNDSTFQVESVEEVVAREGDIEEFYVAEMDEVGFVFSYFEEGYDLYVRVV